MFVTNISIIQQPRLISFEACISTVCRHMQYLGTRCQSARRCKSSVR